MITKYQKIINLIDNTSNQTCNFRTRNEAEVNYIIRGTYNVSNQSKFKTSMVRSYVSQSEQPQSQPQLQIIKTSK